MRARLWLFGGFLLVVIFWCAPVLAAPLIDSVNIRILYSGHWSGSYSSNGAMQTIDGDGNKTIQVNRQDTGFWTVHVMVYKGDVNNESLTVSIETLDGTVLKSGTTSAQFGMVSVYWSDTGSSPGIPGFPFGAVALGSFAAIALGIVFRRRAKL